MLAQCRAQWACSFVQFHCFGAKTYTSYLNYLSVDIQHSLAEVHPDGGLHSLGELPGAESVCEAGLPHPGVPYHQHFKGPIAAQQWGHAAQRAGKLERWLHLPVVHSKQGAKKNALGVKRYISKKCFHRRSFTKSEQKVRTSGKKTVLSAAVALEEAFPPTSSLKTLDGAERPEWKEWVWPLIWQHGDDCCLRVESSSSAYGFKFLRQVNMTGSS